MEEEWGGETQERGEEAEVYCGRHLGGSRRARLTGHLHGLGPGLAVEGGGGAGAVQLGAAEAVGVAAVRGAHAGGGLGARAGQSGHARRGN